MSGHVGIVLQLLDKGANPYARSNDGTTAVHLASEVRERPLPMRPSACVVRPRAAQPSQPSHRPADHTSHATPDPIRLLKSAHANALSSKPTLTPNR